MVVAGASRDAEHIRREIAEPISGLPESQCVRPVGGDGVRQNRPKRCPPTLSRKSASPTKLRPFGERVRPPRELIETELAKGRNAMAIWENLVDGHGLAGR
jgi:hypothetical protein